MSDIYDPAADVPTTNRYGPMKATDVFTPGKTPTVTFVDDHLVKRREYFQDAIAQEGMLINVSGPSKSGKTVFVRNMVGAENLVAVTGAGVSTPSELWRRVFHQIGTPLPDSQATESNRQVTIGASGKAGANIFLAKGEAGASMTGSAGAKSVRSDALPLDELQLLIKEFSGSGMVLFIDDFHYMSREVQEHVARQIKEAIARGVIIVCASVPYRSEDVLRANADLRGRIMSIDFDYWKQQDLAKIAMLGFEQLNLDCPEVFVRSFAEEAAGSPQLMQSICLNACFEGSFREKRPSRESMPTSVGFFTDVCTRTAINTDYSGTLEKLLGVASENGK